MSSRSDATGQLARPVPKKSGSNDASSARKTVKAGVVLQVLSSLSRYWNSHGLLWKCAVGSASVLLAGSLAGLACLKLAHLRARRIAALPPPERQIPQSLAPCFTGFSNTLPPAVTDAQGNVNYGIFRKAIQEVNVEQQELPFPFGGILAPLRHKKWHFHAIETKDLYVTLVVLHAGYASKAVMLLYKKAGGEVYTFDATAPLNFGLTSFAGSSVDERTATEFNFAGNKLRMVYVKDQHWCITGSLLLQHVNGNSQALRATFEITVVDSHATADQLALVFPFTEMSPAYTHKAMCLATKGHVKLGTEMFVMDDTRGALDWTSVYAPYLTRWQWLFVSGTTKAGKQFGINLSSLDHYHSKENAIWIDGVAHLVGPVRFVLPVSPQLESHDDATPWAIESLDGKLNLSFTPTYKKSVPMNAGFIESNYLQILGDISGTFELAGVTSEVEKVFGICERQQCMW